MTRFARLLSATVLIGASMLTVNPGRAQDPAREVGEPLFELASEKAPTSYASAEDVLAAFKTAVTAGDGDALNSLLGLDPVKTKAVDGAAEALALLQEGVKRNVLLRDKDKGKDGAKTVYIGDRLWPLPFPISRKDDGKWSFDTYAGLDEIVARRVGENELLAIGTVRAYVDAQFAYEQQDFDGDGVLEFAQKLVSKDGARDGLYWEDQFADDGGSPGGVALVNAEFDKAKKGEGFFGYHFRILTSQGANIAGGQFDYVINGNMIAGFGLVAWPVKYGETGIRTFVVNKEGVIYQADLGENTTRMASDIRTFNPGDAWTIVDDQGEDDDGDD